VYPVKQVVEVVKSSLVECRCIEIANHLGNTLATISDRKTATGASGTPVTFFQPITQTANDYYPFGMIMPGRNYNNGTTKDYRYGFNGKENDNEVKGEGNQQDYGMRIYDPRLGKFLSVDPISSDYPWYTPYQFAGNKPIEAIDLDGAEELKVKFLNPPTTSFLGAPTSQDMLRPAFINPPNYSVPWTRTPPPAPNTHVLTETAEYAAAKLQRKIFRNSPITKLGLTAVAILSPLEAHAPGIPQYMKPAPAPAPAPVPVATPKPTPDPTKEKPGPGQAVLYKTKSDAKSTGSGGKYDGYVATSSPIPYVGITTAAPVGGRYSPVSIQGKFLGIIGIGQLPTIQGAETAVIALNTYGVNYKQHLTSLNNEDVKACTRIANLTFTHKAIDKIRLGIAWLNGVRPGWDKPGHPNSLLFPANKAGVNNPANAQPAPTTPANNTPPSNNTNPPSNATGTGG
jgi:RHS repeat-associated protein